MKAAALLALLALPAAPASAQDRCAAALAAATASLGAWDAAGGVSADPGRWCEARDLRVANPALGDRVSLRMEALRWRGQGIEAALAGTGLPTELDLEVAGLRVVPVTGDAGYDWLLAAQGARAGLDGRMRLDWDEGSRELRLRRLDVSVGDLGSLEASATVAGVDLSSLDALATSLGSASLVAADLELETEGLFEAYLLLPLAGPRLSGAADPEAEADALRRRLVDGALSLPAGLFPGDTRSELAELAASLPNPGGTLTAAFRAGAGGGLGLPRLARFALTGAPATPADLWPALEGLTLTAEWEADD